MQNHRNLLIWQQSHALAIETQRVLRCFPRSGHGKLKSQIAGAVESIVFNIVEGCGAESTKEFARFLGISIKSTTEFGGQLELAREYGIVRHAACKRLTQEATEIRRMTYGLRKKLRDKDRDDEKDTG